MWAIHQSRFTFSILRMCRRGIGGDVSPSSIAHSTLALHDATLRRVVTAPLPYRHPRVSFPVCCSRLIVVEAVGCWLLLVEVGLLFDEAFRTTVAFPLPYDSGKASYFATKLEK